MEVVHGGFFTLTAPHDMTKPFTESGQTLTLYALFYHHVMNSWWMVLLYSWQWSNDRCSLQGLQGFLDSPSNILYRSRSREQATLTSVWVWGRPSWTVVTFRCEQMTPEKSKGRIWDDLRTSTSSNDVTISGWPTLISGFFLRIDCQDWQTPILSFLKAKMNSFCMARWWL